MRIGILTFHRGNNYGGILQCYALQQVLKKLGHTVEVIDYRHNDNRGLVRKLYSKYSTADNIGELLSSLSDFICKHRTVPFDKTLNDASIKEFDKFRSTYLNISKPLDSNTIGDYANAEYDLIITGSDQVWTSLFDDPMVYMIDWKPQFQGKRMSYAACSAHKNLRGSQRNVVKGCLSKFDLITVRDSTTQQLVKNVLGKVPQIVPDPSLLYPYDEFKTQKQTEPYILTYILGDEIEGGHDVALRKIKQQVGDLPVYAIVIPCNSRDITKYADKVFETLSPEQWVDMFYHARYVYTDSFHAIMFSLKFEKPFVAYYRNGIRSSRLMDLKRKGIDSICANVNDIHEVSTIYKDTLLIKDFLQANAIDHDLKESKSDASQSLLKEMSEILKYKL